MYTKFFRCPQKKNSNCNRADHLVIPLVPIHIPGYVLCIYQTYILLLYESMLHLDDTRLRFHHEEFFLIDLTAHFARISNI